MGATESMSKSKKNTIDPEKIISNYGADAVRLFILSDSPPEKDVQWSEQGMSASYKFIQKFWTLHEKIKSIYILGKKREFTIFDEDLEEFTNRMIDKININLEKFRYNVIIANLHEIYNFLIKKIQDENHSQNLIANYDKILIIMIPIIPHLTSECLSQIKHVGSITWPSVNRKYLKTEKNTIVVQINGKKRCIIEALEDTEEQIIVEQIKSIKELEKFFNDKKIYKTIFIKNKLINIILK